MTDTTGITGTTNKRVLGAFVAVISVGAACSGTTAGGARSESAGGDKGAVSAESVRRARAVLERLRGQYVVELPEPELEASPQTGARAEVMVKRQLLPPARTQETRREGAIYKMKGQGAVTEVAASGGSFRIVDSGHAGMSAEVAFKGAPTSSVALVEGYLVQPAGGQTSIDLLHRAAADGIEQLVSFDREPGADIFWEVRLGERVAGVRLVADTFELIDDKGFPRLRMAPPMLIDSKHEVQAAQVAVTECAVDTDPSAPWDRPVTPPKSRRCRITLSWERAPAWPALLDPAWTTTGNLATERNFHTATSLGATILVAGGRSALLPSLASAELYNVGAGVFAATASMHGARYGHAAASFDSHGVLVAGGITGAAVSYLATSEGYVPASGRWVAGPPMSISRAFHTATTLSDGNVLVVGGLTAAGPLPGRAAPTLSTEAFVTPTLPAGPPHWVSLGNTAAAHHGHTATLLGTNDVLIAGGTGAVVAERFQYSSLGGVIPPHPHFFTAVGTPLPPRQWHAAALLPSGDVLLAGGTGTADSPITSTVFATATSTFSAAGNLVNAHSACRAVTVPLSGKAILTGGGAAPGNASSELYDPTARSWSIAGALHVPRDGHHTETLLADGRALITGGNTPATFSAELFDPCTGAACDDGNACTTDSCVPSSGCKHIDASACGTPSCSLPTGGACTFHDTDGDGLSDKWETNGYIDVNCNGSHDAGDVSLPGASVTVPDIYVHYDWMELPSTGEACTLDTDCQSMLPATTHQDENCVSNRCTGHTHDPESPASGSIAKVISQFASHGITLHVTRGSARPHSRVTAYQPPHMSCEGADISPGTLGGYAVNFYDLKATSPAPYDPSAKAITHYTMFAHYSSCDSPAHCATCTFTNPDGTIKANPYSFGESGIAELPGNDSIVSLGQLVNDFGITPDQFMVGGTFMHELGHNLGLRHGGGTENGPNFKPNYLSVMNYLYQTAGIQAAAVVGSNIPDPARTRLDYATLALPLGGANPNSLHEAALNEPAGLGSGTADLFNFNDGLCNFQIAASTGPVDWDGNGDTLGNAVSADLNPSDHPTSACGATRNQVLNGHFEWTTAPGVSNFNYAFQCTSGYGDGATLADLLPRGELTAKRAMESHSLFAPLHAVADVRPGCATHYVVEGQKHSEAMVKVALLGDLRFDVRKVDLKSLRFAGATAQSTSFGDVNKDKFPDLVMLFPMNKIELSTAAKTSVVSGYFVNSQAFSATPQVTVVPSAGPVISVRADKLGYSANLGKATGQFTAFSINRCVQSVTDRCGSVLPLNPSDAAITKVTWNEPSVAAQTSVELPPQQPTSVNLRVATTSGVGRVYTIYFEVKDSEGNSTTASCNVGVAGRSGKLPPAEMPPLDCAGKCK